MEKKTQSILSVLYGRRRKKSSFESDADRPTWALFIGHGKPLNSLYRFWCSPVAFRFQQPPIAAAAAAAAAAAGRRCYSAATVAACPAAEAATFCFSRILKYKTDMPRRLRRRRSPFFRVDIPSRESPPKETAIPTAMQRPIWSLDGRDVIYGGPLAGHNW